MAHTYEELKKKTVAQLREVAKEVDHEALGETVGWTPWSATGRPPRPGSTRS